ncbi:MAG: glutathione S-transferase N-terminal domain-containing protein [Myxococcales bacterium]|nr:glutathione S-transferase N-terminal domain-containing protein [Myxococcales bacterium]
MKLYYTPTSPFVRKVLVTARELGLADRIETELLRPTPTKADPTLSKTNPLNKIPALILEDGSALYDSPVICEYLCSIAGDTTVLPTAGAARFRVLRLQALCDGILDAGILHFYERAHRPKELWWGPWLDGQREKALQGLDALEREAASFLDSPVDLAQISAGATIGWLEFREVFGDIRGARPTLSQWYDRFAARESMTQTAPRA